MKTMAMNQQGRGVTETAGSDANLTLSSDSSMHSSTPWGGTENRHPTQTTPPLDPPHFLLLFVFLLLPESPSGHNRGPPLQCS